MDLMAKSSNMDGSLLAESALAACIRHPPSPVIRLVPCEIDVLLCPNCFEFKGDYPRPSFPVYPKGPHDDVPSMSVVDMEFIRLMNSSLVKNSDGNWSVTLPFKDDRP